jgi:hypothetical protein
VGQGLEPEPEQPAPEAAVDQGLEPEPEQQAPEAAVGQGLEPEQPAPDAAAGQGPEPEPEPASAPPPEGAGAEPGPMTEAALGGDTTNFSPDEIRAAIALSMAEQGQAPPAEVPSKLKVRMDGELAENMTKEEVASWVEEGKVKGHHLVAHQFSENWLEAAKVPFLKPVFAKLKPPKRGLFEGLFGRK